MADCCPEWTDAQQRGTDNEGYGALLYFRDDENAEFGYPAGWIMGSDSLKPVRFCPWCGTPKEGRDEPVPETLQGG